MKIPGLTVPVSEKSAKNTSAAKGKSPSETRAPLKNTAKADISHSIKTSGNNISQSKIQASALIKSLGLPADRLSASILSFARFFSLPLEPGFLAKIRRQALSARQIFSAGQQNQYEPATGKPESGLLSKGREAIAFAALAAASKGLELSAAGLAEYAAAMEPDSPFNNGRRKKQSEREKEESNKQEDKKPETITESPSWLKNMILRQEEQNSLINILNKLPGRNGQRWLTLPFSLSEQGYEYSMRLKILINEGQKADCGQMPGQMTLEIARKSIVGAEPSGENQRWLFALEAEGNLGPAGSRRELAENNKNLRMRVCLEPARPKKVLKSLVSGLSEIMQIAPERITVQNFADFSPFEAENKEELLPYVNEEV